jgi:hypothetical protein
MLKKLLFIFFLTLLLLNLTACDYQRQYSSTYTAAGIIIDENNEPLNNVLISFGEQLFAQSKADGSWEKSGLQGEYFVKPSLIEYSFEPASLKISEHGKQEDLTFIGSKVKEEYQLAGWVVDASGEGIEDVRLSFGPAYTSVLTDAAGCWQKEGLKGQVEVKAEKFAFSFQPESILKSAADQELLFRGKSTAEYEICGLVVDQDEQAVPGVEILFSGDYEPVKTDTEGRWKKSKLQGELTVTPHLYDWQFSPANITVSELEAESEIKFKAQPAENYGFYSLSGQVINKAGAGVPAVVIEIKQLSENKLLATAITDAKGCWSVSRIWGRVIITAEPDSKAEIDSFLPQSHLKAGAAENIDFRVE